MLKRLPIKQEHLLFLGIVILIMISYHFAFKNTVVAWQINHQLKERIEQSADLSYQPDYLERKNRNLDKIIGLYKADTTAFRNKIINTIALIAEKQNVQLTAVPVEDVSYNTANFIIEKLAFEGDYFSLNKAVHELQTIRDIGIIRSASWKITGIKSNTDENKKLILEIYFVIAK